MNIGFSSTEIKDLAEQLCPAILNKLDAAIKLHLQSYNPARVYNVKEVAEYLKLSEKTITKYIAEGRLRAKDVATGNKPSWRIYQKAIDDFLAH